MKNHYLATRTSKDAIRVIRIVYNGRSKCIQRWLKILGSRRAELKLEDKPSSKATAAKDIAKLIDMTVNIGYVYLGEFEPSKFDKLPRSWFEECMPKHKKAVMIDRLKPQLPKDHMKVKPVYFNRYWLISPKLEGLHCLMSYNHELGEVEAWDKTGRKITCITHILTNKRLVHLLKNRDITLDGILHIQGMLGDNVKDLAKSDKPCLLLEYWVFDLAITGKQFQHRNELLDKLRHYFIDEQSINVLEHVKCYGWTEIKAIHDKYVGQGHKGAVVRDFVGEYMTNARNNTMIKIEEYNERLYEIIDYTISRGFELATKQGGTFWVKPAVPKVTQDRYERDRDKLIGKKAVIKYFYENDGVPFLPTLRGIKGYG